MASWFTRALDRITPWNRGGELERRRKRDQEQRQRQITSRTRTSTAPGQLRVAVDLDQSNQNITVPKALQPQRPENLFAGLNQNLRIGQPQNPVLVQPNLDSKPAPVIQPGQVVKPTLMVNGKNVDDIPDTPERIIDRGLDAGKSWEQIARENNYKLEGVKEYSQATRPNYGVRVEKPKQGIGNRIRDVFDANTQADKFRRQEGNRKKGEDKPINLVNPGNIVSRTPIVGHAVKTFNTLTRQVPQVGFTAYGTFATREYSAATKEYADAVKSGDKNRITKAKQRVDAAAERVSDANKMQNKVDEGFKKNKGGWFNAGTLFDEEAAERGDLKTAVTDIALPTAVSMLDLYTLGKGSTVSQAVQQGGKGAIRTQAPNIGKMVVGNYASGDLAARSEGATGWDPVKSGAANAVLGTAPDVLLPVVGRSFRNRLIPKFLRRGKVDPTDIIEELDETAISAGAETASQGLRPRPIRVAQNIPVKAAEDIVQVPVVRRPRYPLIKELEGDFNFPTFEELAEIRTTNVREAANAANSTARPDPRIEGISREPAQPYQLTPEAVKSTQDEAIDSYADMLRDMGEGNGTQLVPDGEGGYLRTSNNFRTADTAGKRMTKQAWRDQAEAELRAGRAEPGLQKMYDDAADPEVQSLINKGDTTEDAPVGRPIEVKQVNGIPVRDETVVPTDLPEVPGEVRATTATAPANTEAAQVAAQMPTPILPPQIQAILDNPKQFSKRQVQAARNQRKMARQVAKANEDTAAAMERIETASPAAASGEGFTPTGEFGKSVNKGSYQKVSRAAEMQTAVQETANLSPGDVLQTARRNQAETGGFNRRDIRNIAALFETKRLPRGSVEWNEARQILKEDGTIWGQTGALRNYTMRRTATANELINRYESKIYRLAEDPTKIDGKLFDEVEAAEVAYTDARDAALLAYNRFTENPTSANAKAYHAAQDAAEKADKAAKITEYRAADKMLKGNKDIKQARELEKMANEADLYQMDAVDASMLSGTGTFVRNFVNAMVGGTEEAIFGGAASRISRLLTRENVGGGFGRGTFKGFKEGAGNVVNVSKARAGNAGWNPLKHIKNWATTGNQLSDAVIDTQVTHNVLDHYTQVLKEQGFKGRELRDRASVMARQDPDNLGRTYANAARTAAGLGAGITRNNKIETIVKNMISDTLSFGNANRVSEGTAKLITRMTIGFPTAIGRSTAEGVKRFSLGAPTFIKAMVTKDPTQRALLIKEGIKQAGSGSLVVPPLFYALGQAGLITGAYPKDDPEERARWERDGISENSIKIGGAYYQLPAYLGAWAVPGLFYASLGRNEGNFGAAAADVAKAVPAILPTDNISNWLDVINGRSAPGKFIAQTAASATRAATPGGALLAQIAKTFDPTKNDTTSGAILENFIDKVMTGIPGASNTVPNKEDDAGNVIENPNPGQLLFGAASKVQTAGEERTAQLGAEIDSSVKGLNDLGALSDPNLASVLDDKEKAILDKINRGKKVDQGDVKKLQEALVKGVSQTGDDTAYLEREQYDSNLTALKLKKQLMESDKSVKPSDVKKIDIAIKRGEIYRDNQMPYEMIDAYQTTTLEEWRKMGDPEHDDYDPDMYQKLWAIDEMLTKAGVSYKKGALDKQKYYAKAAGKGRSGSRGRGGSRGDGLDASTLSPEFGKLKPGDFAPSVQAYENIEQRSGQIPIIRTVRPNIVHKIGSSG